MPDDGINMRDWCPLKCTPQFGKPDLCLQFTDFRFGWILAAILSSRQTENREPETGIHRLSNQGLKQMFRERQREREKRPEE